MVSEICETQPLKSRQWTEWVLAETAKTFDSTVFVLVQNRAKHHRYHIGRTSQPLRSLLKTLQCVTLPRSAAGRLKRFFENAHSLDFIIYTVHGSLQGCQTSDDWCIHTSYIKLRWIFVEIWLYCTISWGSDSTPWKTLSYLSQKIMHTKTSAFGKL